MDATERIQVALELESSLRDQNQRLSRLLTGSTDADLLQLLNRLNLALFDAKVFIEEYRNQLESPRQKTFQNAPAEERFEKPTASIAEMPPAPAAQTRQ